MLVIKTFAFFFKWTKKHDDKWVEIAGKSPIGALGLATAAVSPFIFQTCSTNMYYQVERALRCWAGLPEDSADQTAMRPYTKRRSKARKEPTNVTTHMPLDPPRAPTLTVTPSDPSTSTVTSLDPSTSTATSLDPSTSTMAPLNPPTSKRRPKDLTKIDEFNHDKWRRPTIDWIKCAAKEKFDSLVTIQALIEKVNLVCGDGGSLTQGTVPMDASRTFCPCELNMVESDLE